MKTHYKVLLLCIILFLLPIHAFTHAGHTGVDGGHIDSETGEYHYHHGYPAHDHEDIDGDGIVDCPYDFDDKTDHESGNGSGTAPNNGDTGKTDIPDNDATSGKTLWDSLNTFFLE